MDEHYITGSEFTLIVVTATIFPWLVMCTIQTYYFIQRNVPIRPILVAAIILFFSTIILGIAIWLLAPQTNTLWQAFLFKNTNATFLPFLPLGSMLLAALISALPISKFVVHNLSPRVDSFHFLCTDDSLTHN